jgi:hypothetical protein
LSVLPQEFNKKIISTTSKSLLIELASVERITLKMKDSSEKIEVLYKNTDQINTPMISDNIGLVHIKVSKTATKIKRLDKNKYRAGQPVYPSYEIIIPRGMNVQLLYDKGNFNASNFKGHLNLHLNSGKVTIDQFKGFVSVESFSGIINCSIEAARVTVNSNTGEIVTNLKDKRLIKTQNSLKGIFKNANDVLKIKTIHAKVNLKSISTQK